MTNYMDLSGKIALIGNGLPMLDLATRRGSRLPAGELPWQYSGNVPLLPGDAGLPTLAGGSGTIGINITGAKTVLLEHDKIDGFSGAGISDARTGGGTRLIIRDTIVENNGGAGVAAVAGATNSVVLENVASIGNKYGVAAATGNNVVVSRSVLSASTVAGVEADPGAQVLVDNTEITHNIVAGVQANGTIVLGNSDIAFNTTGITGAATSFGNNRIFGNAAPGTTPTAGAATTDHGQE